MNFLVQRETKVNKLSNTENHIETEKQKAQEKNLDSPWRNSSVSRNSRRYNSRTTL